MTKEALQFNLGQRRKKMEQFIANPDNYKVCEQCNSIVFVRARVCQLCACYRFDYSREAVIRISRITSQPCLLNATKGRSANSRLTRGWILMETV